MSWQEADLLSGKTNTREENKLVDFSLGYFLADLIFILLFERDAMFIIHHAIALLNFGSARLMADGKGVASVLSYIGFAFGEASTPLQNLWCVSASHIHPEHDFERDVWCRWLCKRAQNKTWAGSTLPSSLTIH